MSLQSPDDGPTNGPLQILTPRMYQKRVVDFAIAQNTLAVLPTGEFHTLHFTRIYPRQPHPPKNFASPTGSGKTLIAVKLIEHFLSQSYSPRRIVAFLAPTTVLVEQQRLYVQTHCVGIVRSYIGETSSKGVSIQKWGREEWAAEVKEVNVMVMTPEILRDAFSRKLVEVSSFSLVILDEVHNATGSSPMALVCELIHKSEPLTSGEDSGSNATLRPRILGLTASPINNKQSNSRAKIEALLSTTQCKLLAPAEDLEEILTHTPVPDIFILRHGPGIQTSAFASYTSAFKPSNYMHVFYLAYLRARHANYLNSFAKLALKLKMPLHHFSQIQPLCLPPTFLAGRGGYLLDMLQQVLHRIYKIAEEGGAFLAIVALQLALEANSQNFLGFSIYKSNQTVNMDRVVQQVAEIQNGPFEVTTLIAYSRVYITSLVDAFVALSLGLPTAVRDRFILSLGCKEQTTNPPIMRRLHGILEAQNLLGTYNINGGGFLAHVNENYAVAELKSCISECCRLAMRSLRQEDFIACFTEEISIYPYIYNLVNYCDPAVTFSHLANMRALPEEPSLFSHKLGLTLAYIFQQAEERSGESWACIVFSQLCLTSKAMNAVMALLIDLIRDNNSKEIGRKLELNSRCIVGNDQQSIRNQLECLLSFKV